MMLNLMGRPNMLRGCQEFIRRFEKGPDHPVLQDFTQVLREFAPDKETYDAFVGQWYQHVVVPEYKLENVARTPGSSDASWLEHMKDKLLPTNSVWEVKLTLHNAGTGAMPVVVCASRGERFPDGQTQKKAESPSDSSVVVAAEKSAEAKDEPYRDARTCVTLGAGESKEVVIRCEFEPQQVTVDPDALVLQLRRKFALFKF
jgi:hypothetical protein